MGIVLLIIIIGVVCFLIGKKIGSKNHTLVHQPQTPVKPIYKEQPVKEVKKTVDDKPKEHISIIKTINGVDYDLTGVVELIQEGKYDIAQKEFERITGMKHYSTFASPPEQVESANVYDELYWNYKKRGDAAFDAMLRQMLANNDEQRKIAKQEKARYEQLRQQIEAEKKAKKKIPWALVGVAMHRAQDEAIRKRKRDMDLQRAIDKINKQ